METRHISAKQRDSSSEHSDEGSPEHAGSFASGSSPEHTPPLTSVIPNNSPPRSLAAGQGEPQRPLTPPSQDPKVLENPDRALMQAILRDKPLNYQKLICDLGLTYTYCNPKTKSNIMQCALSQKAFELVLYMLGKGGRIDAPNQERQTALHHFANHENHTVQHYPIEIMRFCLEHGANINAIDKLGNTPLHIAAAAGNQEVVAFLLQQKGVNPNQRNTEGLNALEYANKYCQNPEYKEAVKAILSPYIYSTQRAQLPYTPQNVVYSRTQLVREQPPAKDVVANGVFSYSTRTPSAATLPPPVAYAAPSPTIVAPVEYAARPSATPSPALHGRPPVNPKVEEVKQKADKQRADKERARDQKKEDDKHKEQQAGKLGVFSRVKAVFA